MKIILTNKKRPEYWHNETLFYPLNDSDMKLFMHCTSGHIAVTLEFLKAYLPVFENHGIEIENVA